MGDIAEDEYGLAAEVFPPDLTQGEPVQKVLGGMGMAAVTRVDNGAVQPFGQKGGCTAGPMAKDDPVGSHGLEGQGRVFEGLALLQGAAGLGQGKGVCGESFACYIERCLGPRGCLGKKKDNAFALEYRNLFDRPHVHFIEPVGHLENISDFIPVQL